jgi:hypothetical protein
MSTNKSVFAIPAFLLTISLSACSLGNSEAETSAKTDAACVFISTPYTNWITSGGDTSSPTGRLGREATLSGINGAKDELSAMVTQDELDAANEIFRDKESDFTTSDLLAAVYEFEDQINDWESMNVTPWTAGDMASIDADFQKIQSICGELRK